MPEAYQFFPSTITGDYSNSLNSGNRYAERWKPRVVLGCTRCVEIFIPYQVVMALWTAYSTMLTHL